MGNPNCRRKQTIETIANEQSPVSGVGAATASSPLVPTEQKMESTDNHKDVQGVAGTPENMIVDKGKGKGSFVQPSPTAGAGAVYTSTPARRDSLAFRSYKTGSLLTDNFQPTFVPVTMYPFPPPPKSASSLSGATPPFVPSATGTLSTYSPALFPTPGRPTPQPGTGLQQLRQMVYEVQTRKNDPFLTPPTAPRAHFTGRRFNSTGSNLVSPLPTHHGYAQAAAPSLRQIMDTFPTPPLSNALPAPASIREPTTFLTKRDKLRKDIVITDDGIERNIARITERFLPNGFPYQTMSEEFDAKNYNLMEHIKGMDEVTKKAFLNGTTVQIIVKLKPEAEDAALTVVVGERNPVVYRAPGGSAIYLAAVSSSSTSGLSDSSSSTATLVNSKAVAVVNASSGLIDNLKSLPESFHLYVEKLTVTLTFPVLESATSPGSPEPSAPVPSPPTPTRAASNHKAHDFNNANTSTAYQYSPNFILMTKIVDELYKFKNLTKLDVVISPPATMRTPMSLPQLNCVLPFYDLEFLGWNVFWQSPFMSKPEPLRNWPLDYLNKQRDRICYEREERINNMVCITPSAAVGPPINIFSEKKKKPVVVAKAVAKDVKTPTRSVSAKGAAKGVNPAVAGKNDVPGASSGVANKKPVARRF